jgi:restriction system protein
MPRSVFVILFYHSDDRIEIRLLSVLRNLSYLSEIHMLPKHKYLLTYRYAEIIHDLTVEFCQNFFLSNVSYSRNLGNLNKIPVRRTIDQMVQAARSGKQNIVEGVGQSPTSKKGEIKLLGVAKASLEELTSDYEDYLRQRKLSIWPKTDQKVIKLREDGYRLSNLRNLSPIGDFIEKPKLPDKPDEAANFLLTLCHMVTFLLSKQIQSLDNRFIKNGGYTENLFKRRIRDKIGR